MGYKNLVLIDDDSDDQEIFIEVLKRLTKSVICTAYNGAREALQSLIAKEIRPDVIFLDLNMPVMSGQQFLIEIKKLENLKDIPVIIFSTSSHTATIQLTKDLGAHDFITKPNNFDDLATLLKPLID